MICCRKHNPVSKLFLPKNHFDVSKWSVDWYVGLSMIACPISDQFFTLRNEDMLMKYLAAAAAKSLQSCPTLCDPIDGSPPGSPVPGILQARTLEWVAISFSKIDHNCAGEGPADVSSFWQKVCLHNKESDRMVCGQAHYRINSFPL